MGNLFLIMEDLILVVRQALKHGRSVRLPGRICSIQEDAMTRNKVVEERMHNEEMLIRSLKEKGYYRSGIPLPPPGCN